MASEQERPAKVNLAEKLAAFDEPWSPKIVAELNDAYVKVVKFDGEFVWHHHDQEDEMFLVLRGRMRMELRDWAIELGEGEAFVVPRGVEHRPGAVGQRRGHDVTLAAPVPGPRPREAASRRRVPGGRFCLAERGRRPRPPRRDADPAHPIGFVVQFAGLAPSSRRWCRNRLATLMGGCAPCWVMLSANPSALPAHRF